MKHSIRIFLLLFIFSSCTKSEKVFPYKDYSYQPSIKANCGVVLDYYSEDILYQKEANVVMPPASMIKLVLFYAIMEEIKKGSCTLDTFVPIDHKADYKNQPARSSVMYLESGDVVTVKELLQGLIIPSGNDAAIALSSFLATLVNEDGVERLNKLVKTLGLVETKIVEPSGYSSENKTTAYEFAKFALALWKRFPAEVEEFCTIKRFIYPEQKNIPSGRSGLYPKEHDNHNELVSRFEGVIGLKTGYIDQSKANVTLGYSKEGTKFIVVLMGGPGDTGYERSLQRAIDGATLLSWATSNYKALSFKGPTDLTIKEKKSAEVYPVYGVEGEYKTFAIDDIKRMKLVYTVKKGFKKRESRLPTKVGKWRVVCNKETLASGNLFVD